MLHIYEAKFKKIKNSLIVLIKLYVHLVVYNNFDSGFDAGSGPLLKSFSVY